MRPGRRNCWRLQRQWHVRRMRRCTHEPIGGCFSHVKKRCSEEATRRVPGSKKQYGAHGKKQSSTGETVSGRILWAPARRSFTTLDDGGMLFGAHQPILWHAICLSSGDNKGVLVRKVVLLERGETAQLH